MFNQAQLVLGNKNSLQQNQYKHVLTMTHDTETEYYVNSSKLFLDLTP